MKISIHGKTVSNSEIPIIMGILNMTPDSFSDGGTAVSFQERIRTMIAQGAAMIDVGGESTRPGAAEIPAEEEIRRVLPAFRFLKENFPEIMVSIDTRKSAVAEEALKAGADLVNDVSGLTFDPHIAETAAKYQAGMVLMHTRSVPADMQNHTDYDNPIREIREFLRTAAQKAEAAGVRRDSLLLDPGIGFAKDAALSAAVIQAGPEFAALGYPLLSGPSRKSFIGKITGEPDPSERDYGTCGAVIASAECGYSVFRVHNVKAAMDALKVWKAIRSR